MEIAVLVDNQDHVAHFEQGGTVKIFTKVNGVWLSARELDYVIQGLENPEMFRTRLSELCQWMAPCKILVAGKFRGTYRVVFERFQIAMWALEGFAQMCVQDFLDDIYQFYMKEKQNTQINAKAQQHTPMEIRDGCFSIDLTDVMAHRTSLNSQQVLLPFFQHQKFSELEILCEHVPKWFEQELPKLRLRAEEEICENRIKVKVFPVNS